MTMVIQQAMIISGTSEADQWRSYKMTDMCVSHIKSNRKTGYIL